jgi:exonuclease III
MTPAIRFCKGRWLNCKGPVKTSSQVPTLKHVVLNVNGINSARKRNVLSSIKKERDWGILYLSDTRIHDDREIKGLEFSLGFRESVWSLGTPNVGGTAILFYTPVVIKDKFSDPLGRFTKVDYVRQEATFSSICIYAPASPTERKRLLSNVLMPYLQAHPPQKKCFSGGDFNFVEDPGLDRSSSNQGGSVGLDQWTSITDLLELKDLFRLFHPSKKSFTFHSGAHNMQTRIDRLYASKEALPFSDSCTHVVLPRSLSDHQCAVQFTSRAITAAARGPSY